MKWIVIVDMSMTRYYRIEGETKEEALENYYEQLPEPFKERIHDSELEMEKQDAEEIEYCLCWNCDYICCISYESDCNTCSDKVKSCPSFTKQIKRSN